MDIYSTVINDLGVIIGVVGTIFGLNRKFPIISKTVHFLEANAELIGKEVGIVVETFSATPAGETVKAALQKEVDHVSTKLQDSELAKLALIGLKSFSTKVENLSDTQKSALVKFVLESVPADWGIDESKVTDALNTAEKLVTQFNNLEIVKAANFFTDEQNKKLVTATVAPTTQDSTQV
jgi:hypothetical protein